MVEARVRRTLRDTSSCSVIYHLVCGRQKQTCVQTIQLAAGYTLQGLVCLQLCLCARMQKGCNIAKVVMLQVVPGTLAGKKDIVDIQHRILVSCPTA